jgi:predicted YcjX-like family ATPase
MVEMERGLAAVLKAFRPGINSWLAALGGRRIDRLLFAATKADHIHHSSHDRLEALLGLLTERAGERATGAGAEVQVLGLASLRSTREAEARDGRGMLPCIVGVPLAGETVAGATFDGRREVALFPGDLPADPRAALDLARQGPASPATFPRFRPPRLLEPTRAGESRPAPHIRLDRALEFLLGDWLA